MPVTGYFVSETPKSRFGIAVKNGRDWRNCVEPEMESFFLVETLKSRNEFVRKVLSTFRP